MARGAMGCLALDGQEQTTGTPAQLGVMDSSAKNGPTTHVPFGTTEIVAFAGVGSAQMMTARNGVPELIA